MQPLAPAGRWPLADERVKQVKQANDIVEVIGGYLALRPAGGTFKGLCPFHDDTRPSFDVDPRRGRFRCWACGKYGDVISFVQEFERVTFPEALELLARRAGIVLEDRANMDQQARERVALLDVMRWACKQFHEYLTDSLAEGAREARQYLAERGLGSEIVRGYSLGYAPRQGEWLVSQAQAANVHMELLEKVGLVAARRSGEETEIEAPRGYYDRFRDRLQFPIRDVRGQVVGFGGRILPTSPLFSRGPKYYNSCDTPLFTKSEHLYGLDVARGAAVKVGYLAVVEGYTDVLMAHQRGIHQVVATMGTALNERHLRQLRRFAPRVVLVFDADAGGATGVDRALELFASHDAELSIATLPTGLDPYDLLMRDGGVDAFRLVLETAVDALEFKLEQALAREGENSVEARRRVLEAVLGVIALAPALKGQAGAVKTQLMMNRIAQRLNLKEETIWARLDELRREAAHRGRGATARPPVAERSAPSREEAPTEERRAAAPEEEKQLLQVLLADPDLLPEARSALRPEEITHPGLRRLYDGLVALQASGEPATLDALRPGIDNLRLFEKALEMQEIGRANANRPAWLRQILQSFRSRRDRAVRQEIQHQLQTATRAGDSRAVAELLRRLQNLSNANSTDTSAQGWGSSPTSSDSGVRS
jgi:DNA primase